MAADIDDALLRLRRSTEWTGLISRSAAVLWIFASFVLLPAPALLSAPAWLSGLLMALPEAAINVVAVYALRNVAHRRYPWISAAILAIDTATIVVMVAVTPGADLWPLLIIPILIGAYRHQLAGALTTCVFTAASCVLLYSHGPELVGRAFSDELVTIAPGLQVVVALMTGLLSRGHHRHLQQLSSARATLRQQAFHDPLTGLGNRNLLHEHARTSVAPGSTVSVLVLDLDGFKAVNDTLGHAAGDELLRVVAGRLRTQSRERDLVARLGGDEFVVLLHDADHRTARETADRLRFALLSPVVLDGREVTVDASIGVATAADASLDELLRAADADMYRVKSAHRILTPPENIPA
ncbi:diguanylate cyclase [Dactylosporangium sp. AC04546]|uniref:GGDEF domain-containing protein n=1 Tax=Dactylosporangium sp. AC04546 TaxID=2862460 RepID=UPI001EDD2D74|nr:diguanylate cyclase [Dactylosporangium sp. AC04546]WVK85822.1 diguanylate cyclase [Dactylosporangium sp. AC04546]